MPLVAKAGVLWCLVALLALGSWGARACTFHLEEEQIALSKADIVRATTGNLIDSPISLFTHGGETYWILPSVLHRRGEAFVYHAVTKGPLSEPTRELIGDWPEDDFFEGDIGMKWVTNTYQHPDGVLAFVHTEYAGPGQYYGKKITTSDGKTKTLRGPGHSRIGLAWYPHPDPDNTPPTFRYLGHIIQPHREKRFEAWNVHGTPYLIHTINGEEWFYIYFFDAP
ncbi:MAG TPA: hypothetical protein VKA18_14110, partial [Alphaproteobacteria bacterium]|nr:hypothetical protein [Alphaproteobacteria bacterium]